MALNGSALPPPPPKSAPADKVFPQVFLPSVALTRTLAGRQLLSVHSRCSPPYLSAPTPRVVTHRPVRYFSWTKVGHHRTDAIRIQQPTQGRHLGVYVLSCVKNASPDGLLGCGLYVVPARAMAEGEGRVKGQPMRSMPMSAMELGAALQCGNACLRPPATACRINAKRPAPIIANQVENLMSLSSILVESIEERTNLSQNPRICESFMGNVHILLRTSLPY